MRKPDATGLLLVQLVAEKSATPEGFALGDAKHLQTQYTQKLCQRQVAKGVLFRGCIGPMLVRFFSTAQAARQFETSNRQDWLVPKKATFHISSKPKPQPAPRPDAVTVHTVHTIYTSRATPPGRFSVEVPMQRMGTASWVTL